MDKYELDFGSNTIENIISNRRRNMRNLEMLFKNKRYNVLGYNVGEYLIGNASIFFNKSEKIGYKVFLSFNRSWIEWEPFQTIKNYDRIVEIKKIYDVLYENSLSPKVYDIFEAKIYFNNKEEKYISYGLKLERIIEKKEPENKVFMERIRNKFEEKLLKICEENYIIRLSRPERKKIFKKEKITGSIEGIKREIFLNRNTIYSDKGYIFVDIDMMFFINEGFVCREFEF